MKTIKSIPIFMLLIMLLMASPKPSSAQCAMCRRIAETSIENQKNNSNPNVGRGLNKGILYMLCFPYLLGATGGIIWYRSRKKRKKE
jgi:hypothetical protein